MPKARILVASAAFALLVFVEGRAHATVSAVTVNTTVLRCATTGCPTGMSTYECPGRGPNVTGCLVDATYQGIGFHDCMDDSQLQFAVDITGLPDTTGNLQIWAGTTDCTQQGATNNNTTATCWMVAPPVGAPQPVTDVIVRVADIAGYLGQTNPNLPQTYKQADVATACTNSTASTTVTNTDDAGNTTSTVGEATVNIYFLWFLNSNPSAPAVSSTAYPVKVKLLGPAAVTGLTVQTSDSALVVGWLPPGGDTTIQGYDLFASTGATPVTDATTEAATMLVAPDGGVCPDGDVTAVLDDAGNQVFDDAGNAVFQDAGCYSQIVPPGSGQCGSTLDTSSISCTGDGGASAGGFCQQVNGPTNASATLTGLTNNTAYNVAVAAFDQYGNVGQVSGALCGTPQPVQDFWKTYNGDGGNAFCALEFVGRGGGTVAAGLVGLAGLVFVKRRKRQNR